MAVVRGNTTSIGKRSMCSTGGLRASLFFLSCIFFFHILMCFEKLLLLLRRVNDEDTAR